MTPTQEISPKILAMIHLAQTRDSINDLIHTQSHIRTDTYSDIL